MAFSVTHICKKFYPIKGGIEVVVDNICRATHKTSDNYVVCCGDNDVERYEYAKVNQVKSYFELFSTPIAPRIFVEVYKAFINSDVICVHYPFPYADVCIAIIGFFSKKRVVVYWHSNVYSQKILKWVLFPFTYLML